MNSCTSPLSSLDNKYTFSFLNTNPSFVSIVWSQGFLVGICSLAFLPNTWIYVWNLSGTNFFASSSNFAASFSSLFQISHSCTTLFTSIIFSLFGFLCSFCSCLFSASSFSSSSFCFCHSDFPCFGLYCFPHSFGHLIILTSPVLQSISGLWCASHSISKIMFHFCSLITLISVLSLCPW